MSKNGTERSIRKLAAQIALQARHNPYDPTLPELRAELAELHKQLDRERVEEIHFELGDMTPAEIRRIALAARKNDRERAQRMARAS